MILYDVVRALVLLFWLLVGHALCDFPLQQAYLSRAKNRWANPPSDTPWWIALLAHGLIHGGSVALLTGRIELGIAETVLHMIIDYNKCAGRIGVVLDQALHVLCKVVWVIVWSNL